MSEVVVRGVRAGYGEAVVLAGVDLTVPTGTTTAVLGSSGGGKTTLLRCIAGFLHPTGGSIAVGGHILCDDGVFVAPERRGIGYVRQDGALFPHLDVAANITFGLSWARRRRRDRVAELLDLVGLSPDLADRRPEQLSGGQQQRVALARALAAEPDVVLLDEPFSSLDSALRASTRAATAAALRAGGSTAILVTHDQSEALSFADQVAILRDGVFSQVGTPREIYHAPVDRHGARFLGEAVLLPGHGRGPEVECAVGLLPVAGRPVDGDVEVMVRPEQIELCPPGLGVAAVVESTTYYGHDAMVELLLAPDDAAPSTRVTARVIGAVSPRPGDAVAVRVTGAVRTFPLS